MHESGPCYCLNILVIINISMIQNVKGYLKLSSSCFLRIVQDSIETPKAVSLNNVILLMIKLL